MRSRLLAFIVLAALLPFLTGATIIIRGPQVAATSFTYYSATFTGDDWLSRGAGLTGAADSKLGLLSCWFKFATTGTEEYLLRSTSAWIKVYKSAADRIYVIAAESGASNNVAYIHSSITIDTSWHHLLVSWDAGTTGRLHMYIDGADVSTIDYEGDYAADWTNSDWGVGALHEGSTPFTGKLCEFYLTTPATWFDITNSTNRDKFFNSGTSKPVDLGSDGSTPTGTAPLIYLKTQPPAWETNSGTGGNFTENGAITDGGADKP